jgi:hypothetical protein
LGSVVVSNPWSIASDSVIVAYHLAIVVISAPGAGDICGKPVVWFDFELGEKNHLQGFVCDEHKVSNRVEKLSI